MWPPWRRNGLLGVELLCNPHTGKWVLIGRLTGKFESLDLWCVPEVICITPIASHAGWGFLVTYKMSDRLFPSSYGEQVMVCRNAIAKLVQLLADGIYMQISKQHQNTLGISGLS
jgi:hypothetical protein